MKMIPSHSTASLQRRAVFPFGARSVARRARYESAFTNEHWSMAAQLEYRVLLASTGSGTEPEHWPGAGIVFALRP